MHTQVYCHFQAVCRLAGHGLAHTQISLLIVSHGQLIVEITLKMTLIAQSSIMSLQGCRLAGHCLAHTHRNSLIMVFGTLSVKIVLKITCNALSPVLPEARCW